MERGMRRGAWRWWPLAVSLLFVDGTAALDLVRDGRATATIVLAQPAPQSLVAAADLLREYVRRITGVQLPVVWDASEATGTRILMGPLPEAIGAGPADLAPERLGYDGCLIVARGDELAFLGPRSAGVRNGVAWFVEWKLGVHALGFGPDDVIVPSQTTLSVGDFTYSHRPSFTWRQSWTSVVRGYDGYIRVLDEEEAGREQGYYTLNRRGGVSLSGSHSLYLYVPDSLFATHPEYFPLIGGQRRDRAEDGERVQRVLSNPGVLDLVVQQLAHRYEPDAVAYATVSPNDNPYWCESPADVAMAADPAARMMLFCNRVVEALEPTHPHLGACFLAYSYSSTMTPPLGRRAHPRVVPLVAPLGACPVHRLATSDTCPDQARLRATYDGWRQVAEKVTTYPYAYANVLPLPTPAAVAAETRYYYDQGLFGVQREHMARGFGWEMSYWLEWQMLWDATLDEAMLRRTFLEGWYGAAADPMARVYERVEAAVAAAPVGAVMARDGARNWRGWFEGWTDCFGQALPGLLGTMEANRGDLARALTRADTPRTRAHVERDAADLESMELYALGRLAFDRWDASGLEADRRGALRVIYANLARFQELRGRSRRGSQAQMGQLMKLRDALEQDG